MPRKLIVIYGGGYDKDYKKCVALRTKYIRERFGVTYKLYNHPHSLLIGDDYEVRFYNKYSDISPEELLTAELVNFWIVYGQ